MKRLFVLAATAITLVGCAANQRYVEPDGRVYNEDVYPTYSYYGSPNDPCWPYGCGGASVGLEFGYPGYYAPHYYYSRPPVRYGHVHRGHVHYVHPSYGRGHYGHAHYGHAHDGHGFHGGGHHHGHYGHGGGGFHGHGGGGHHGHH